MNDCIGKAVLKVTEKLTEKSFKSGPLNVLSTAALLGLMQHASLNAISTVCFACGQESVAHRINLDHMNPSIVGSTVTAISRVTDVDSQGVHFSVEAFDETGLVAKGKCSRVFINQDEFEKRCYDKYREAIFKNE